MASPVSISPMPVAVSSASVIVITVPVARSVAAWCQPWEWERCVDRRSRRSRRRSRHARFVTALDTIGRSALVSVVEPNWMLPEWPCETM